MFIQKQTYCNYEHRRPRIQCPIIYPLLLHLFVLHRIMQTIQYVLLAIAATFFTAVNGATLTLVPFYEAMSEGNHVILAEHGPFTFSTSCDSSAVSECFHP